METIETTTAGRSYPKPGGARMGLVGTVALLAAACQTTPVTGTRHFNLFTPRQDVELGREAYEQILEGQPLVSSGPERAMVHRVMDRLVAVADDAGYEWEVQLIADDETVNAFALPGGKMAVYTGILPVCGGETGLAVVMGHEIGHVVAQHGTQRVTRSMPVDLLQSLFDVGDYGAIVDGARTLLFELPFSRGDESEADHIGLVYMARAGYDPREAARFWERMSRGGGGGPPELLSTHPSDETRSERLAELMPMALEIWRTSGANPGGS